MSFIYIFAFSLPLTAVCVLVFVDRYHHVEYAIFRNNIGKVKILKVLDKGVMQLVEKKSNGLFNLIAPIYGLFYKKKTEKTEKTIYCYR